MDPMRIDPGRLQNPLQGLGTGGSDSQQVQQGRFRGEQIQWVKGNDSGPNTDNAEEISMHFAEKAEDEALQDDKLEVRGDQAVMKAEEVMQYLQQAHQGDQAARLQSNAEKLLKGSGHPGAMARQQGGNPLEQFLTLQYALQEGEREGAPSDKLNQLRDALADLEEDHGGDIRARLNTVGVASTQGDTASEVARFQDTYTELVLGAPTLSQTLDLALSRLGAQNLQQGLKALVAALGADLSAARPSTSEVKLQTLVQDLYQLEVVQTVLDGAHELAEGLAVRHGHQGLDAEGLVKQLVKLTGERWVSASRFEQLADDLGVHDDTARIGLFTGIKALMRDLPPRVFADAESRQNSFEALQTALDTVIAREEEG